MLTAAVQYAPINANGTLGTWAATTSFTDNRRNASTVIANGYIYIMGGIDYTFYLDDVQYAPIIANGTIGSWTATRSFTGTRNSQASVTYNGYVYISGGQTP